MAGMSAAFPNLRSDRRGLAGLIMFGVLLLSVAAAWLLIRGRTAAAERGREILQGIRNRKLSAFWGTDPVELWYLSVTADNQPVGWHQMARSYKDGRYFGRTIRRSGKLIVQEEWTLNEDATAGEYAAREGPIVTFIRLEGGNVRVSSNLDREAASDLAPANYIPEGLSPLVFYLAAEAGQAADCQELLKERPIMDGRVNFTPVAMEPAGERRLRVGISRKTEILFAFAPGGRVEQMEHLQAGITDRLVSPDEVTRQFPETLRLRGTEPEPSDPELQPPGPFDAERPPAGPHDVLNL